MTWGLRGDWENFSIQHKWFATGEALAHLDHLVVLGEAEERLVSGDAVFVAAEY